MELYDTFGGWTGKRFRATGFFRTEREGPRWWLVTPEGNSFVSLGINHYHAGWWDQDYNRSHWQNIFGGAGPGESNWIDGYRASAIAQMKHLGISTLGIHSDTLLQKPTPIRPYVARFEPVHIPHYQVATPENFPDVFSETFDEICDQTARQFVAPIKADPLVLGFSMTDCPIFTAQIPA